jgi:TatD DNase family protein
MLIDSHAHLISKFYKENLEEEILKTREKEVFVNNIGFNLESSKEAVAIAKKNKNFFASVGIHPSDVSDSEKETIVELKKLAQDKKAIAIGEIGLDFYRQITDFNLQREKFEEQIYLAKELNIPFIVHSRKSFDDSLDIIKKIGYFNGVFHSFDYGINEAKKVLDLGMYISFSGMLTFKGRNDLIETAKYTPLQKILFETDSPFLAPAPMRGRVNQPAFVEYIYKCYAEVTNTDINEIEDIVRENFNKIFNTNLIEKEVQCLRLPKKKT